MNPTRIPKKSHLLYWARQGHKTYIGGELLQPSSKCPRHKQFTVHRRPHVHCLRIANVISFTDSNFREVKLLSCTQIKEVHCGPIRMQNNTIDRFRGPEIVPVTYIEPQHGRNVYGGRVSWRARTYYLSVICYTQYCAYRQGKCPMQSQVSSMRITCYLWRRVSVIFHSSGVLRLRKKNGKYSEGCGMTPDEI